MTNKEINYNELFNLFVGNETGKYRYRECKLEWIEELINDLTPTTEIFVKQMGTHLSKEMKMTDRHGRNIEEFPVHLQIQNFPLSYNKNLKNGSKI